ncbi:MAG: 3-isopropylmalate dehydratase small subunit [Bacillota bacterium]|jgi:3-isopropylmalate dehydratase small subunit|nr:3-isopropylmalate dehydratase small subunit [Bacillota bacterium]NLU54614.1 3-isopropylmalate dehydratase small subunit [Bacillota bacterium]HOA91911.1 3-isopropylmalate dehydratase small subunit [Bacillota bacterium]HOL13329.1 3-isopropylmalate dehydratase small subunit [Bacillota bacterium]HPQ10874.1 3-isopropylmalate dehydratase small subunit [Bacillota bacterium]
MKFTGRVFVFGDDIDTDAIIPARYLNKSDPEHLKAHCMEDADPTFPEKVKPGDIIVAGKNFGCGSSREHAPLAIKASGVSCVIAESFARIFYRNAINIGLPILEVSIKDLVGDGDTVTVDLDGGTVEVGGKTLKAQAFPPELMEIMQAGGLIAYVKKELGGGGSGE